MPKRQLCVIIPAFNEEVVIGETLRKLKSVIKIENIFVVSDGSTDNTAQVVKSEKVAILALKKNIGKAKAIERLLEKYQLRERYRYIFFCDADSILSDNFLRAIKPHLNRKNACVVGRVASRRYGFISAFRVFEYGFAHFIYKQAQAYIKAVTVAPGCSSIYRSEVLKKLDFNNGTLTEDYDLTIQIHKKSLGEIKYIHNAVVFTQDPGTLKDYWKQIQRWQIGYWQNFILHKLWQPKKMMNLETILLLIDSILGIGFLAFVIVTITTRYPFLISAYVFYTCTALVTIILLKQFWAIKYVPLFFSYYFVNLASFVVAFYKALFSKKTHSWNKVERFA
ncbi:glycosyltransferase [Candidatus Berkelbacteria bacterium]|nr:glycosyltransferase [Candidatus Berkelbacteria bacterium]